MKLEHSFTVPTGIDEAWKILLDIELIGPCMPGAAIDSVDGDDFTGTVKVKLGPIGLTYKGKASFIEKDEAAHRAVIDARGRDARGNGTASAKVTAVLKDQGGSTLVTVDTDLDITGKPAQFGRGVMVDVGNKLIGQFADNLSATISDGSGAPAAAAPAAQSAPDQAAAQAAPAAKTPARKRAARPKPSATPATAEASGAADEAPVTAEPQTPAESIATAGPIERAAVEAVADAPAAYADPAEPQTPTDAPAEPAAGSGDAPAEAEPQTPAETLATARIDVAAVAAVADAPAAYSAPTAEGDGAAVNGHQPRRPATPARDVEPINLLESAGPAVAKRLAPVLLLVALLIVVWRRRASR